MKSLFKIYVTGFPRSESTWISVIPVEGCGNGTCACSSGYAWIQFSRVMQIVTQVHMYQRIGA